MLFREPKLLRKFQETTCGYQIYHNYIREHEGIKGKTPAEAANIHIEGVNKWMTIIQNAAHLKETGNARIDRAEESSSTAFHRA